MSMVPALTAISIACAINDEDPRRDTLRKMHRTMAWLAFPVLTGLALILLCCILSAARLFRYYGERTLVVFPGADLHRTLFADGHMKIVPELPLLCHPETKFVSQAGLAGQVKDNYTPVC
ncbi:hypothetical protein IF2G_10755 [Cordyceps javanica]|nr:hypothetical protein IF2G_10755 [Cordyceps javanica]